MDAPSTPIAQAPAASLSTTQRNWMLFVLLLVGVCAVTDRSIIALVLEPIKIEFHLSDGQLGVLAGLAFSLAHAVVSLPAAALADRTHRTRLIAAALAFWSVATALAGVAQNYVQLLLSRLVVGAGEAGGQSATMSSVADLFPPERRSTAISIYYLCAPVAALLSGVVGGFVAGTYGWRAAMAAVAAPGLLLSIVLIFCPAVPREATPKPKAAPTEAPGWGEVMKFLWSQHALVHVILAAALITLVISGPGTFGFSFFLRYHHMNLRALGPLLGGLSAVIGTVVTLGAGMLADQLGKRDPRLRLWLVVGVLLVATPLTMLAYVAPLAIAFPLYLTHLLIQGAWLGPVFGASQNLAHPRMRSRVAAILFVVNGLVGVGLGPVIAGVLSDVFNAQAPGEGLRLSLILTTGLGFWAALHLYLATRTLKADLARAGAA